MAKDCLFCLYVLNFLCLVERRRSNEYLLLPIIKANHFTTLLDSFGTLLSCSIVALSFLFILEKSLRAPPEGS